MQRARNHDRYRCLRSLLIRYRKASGLTQRQVGTAIGKPQSFISKLENGERRLDVVELLEIVEVLKVNPTVLLRQLSQGRTSKIEAP